MALEEYTLSTVLYGHSLDVRSVAVTNTNCIISGSRDKTSKFWSHNGINSGYIESQTYRGHKNYVSAVSFLNPSPQFPNGLVISGGNDSNICVYTIDNPDPLISVNGHSKTVCCISKGNTTNTFLSSSWDNSAKLWSIVNNSLVELKIYNGHQAAVWSVIQLPNGNVVTGSADKEIFIWAENGQKLKVLKGHTDCVRGLALLNDNMFLSVANDATIKQWTLDGENLDTFYGHGNYIYSVSANRALGEDFFVTSGEDRVVKFWQNGTNYQTITLPAQSVWSVACLANGDIVTGSSDGLVRVFTQDPGRIADAEQLKQFAEEVKNLDASSNQEIGGVKISDLPGKEILYEPGKQDGQTKLVREGQQVVCYSWSASDGTWNKIGDVMGASGGTQATSGKTLYEGREYDFVFSVDIEDGKPPLKLPYNKDQDPWVAAQEFIHKNNLSQMFLDQVANFIVQNSGAVIIEQRNPDFVDPFTGGNRYVPGGGLSANTNTSGQNLDPFTGASSYTTNTQSNTQNPKLRQKSEYFPHTSYLYFDQGNLGVILEKLKEFNKKNGDSANNVDENLIEGVVKLADGSKTDSTYISALLKILQWPQDVVFPVLDVTRLALRHLDNNNILCSHNNGSNLIQLLRNFIAQENIANKMLSLRILCNMFSHSSGENLILRHEHQILNDFLTLNNLNKNCQIALATFLLNLSILLLKSNKPRLPNIIETLSNLIITLEDTEAEFRTFVALGNVMTGIDNNSAVNNEYLSLLKEKLTMVTTSNDSTQQRNINCAKDLYNIL